MPIFISKPCFPPDDSICDSYRKKTLRPHNQDHQTTLRITETILHLKNNYQVHCLFQNVHHTLYLFRKTV